MKKIAIVGVEGSGKTVLMAAMGDKYKSPDANGIFLKPVNRETFAYCEKLMGQMQDGKWPIATGKAITDNLRWTLIKKISDGNDDRIAELSFLDFGGEIYRLAFGGGVHDEPDADTKNAITQLRSHVEEAEVLIVLVNLSDIINGKRNEERTIEMNWLSQAILSFAYDEANKTSVALVFTQADSYAETIAACGGLRGVLTKYMPTVDTSYGKRLALFSVAAVNKTIPAPDGSGFQVPSPDFKPQGLENLVSWVVDYVVEVRRRNELRATQVVEAEESKRKRWKIAVGLIGLLGILGLGARIGYNAINKIWDAPAGVDWEPGKIIDDRKTGQKEGQWLKKCSVCNGRGKKDCWKCDGNGRINCSKCGGSGNVETTARKKCDGCRGTGRMRCHRSDCKFISERRPSRDLSVGDIFFSDILSKEIHVWPCSMCSGTGSVPYFGSCQACGGKGWAERCSTCNGEGSIPYKCPYCDGNGEKSQGVIGVCSVCHGRGTVICPRSECHSGKVSCSSCNGEGWVAE